jgi:hypothetical protein
LSSVSELRFVFVDGARHPRREDEIHEGTVAGHAVMNRYIPELDCILADSGVYRGPAGLLFGQRRSGFHEKHAASFVDFIGSATCGDTRARATTAPGFRTAGR